MQHKLFDYNDRLVNCAYISFRDYDLWNAWRRIWIMGFCLRQFKAGIRKGLKIESGRGEELAKEAMAEDNINYLTPSYEGLGDNFFRRCEETVEKFGDGLISGKDASDKLMSLIKTIDFLPKNYMGLANGSLRFLDTASDFGKSEQWRLLSWAKTTTNEGVRKFFDYNTEDLLATFKK